MHMRDLIRIVEAAEQLPYSNLADAGEDYAPGDTEIWYAKGAYQSQFRQGYDALKQRGLIPDERSIYRTHSMIGTVQETDPERVLIMMQAEAWDPSGQARPMLKDLSVQHSNMSTGDIIVTDDGMYLVDRAGAITALGNNNENQ